MQDFFRVEKNFLSNRDLVLSIMKSGPKFSPNVTKPIQDSVELNNKNKSLTDDGKIPFKEKVKNFAKGFVQPIKTMFSSPKNIALTAGAMIAGGALIALSGGALAPVFVAAGAIAGAVQIGKGIYKQATAKTDDQARQAWQNMGSGTFSLGSSALCAKTSLKVAGAENVKDMGTFSALIKCVKDAPKNIISGFKTIGSKLPKLSTILSFGDNEPKIVQTPEIQASTPETAPERIFMQEFRQKIEQPKLTNSTYRGVQPGNEIVLVKQPAPSEPILTPGDVPAPDTTGIKTSLGAKVKNFLKLFGFFTSEK